MANLSIAGRWIRTLVLLVPFVIIISACGGSGDNKSTGSENGVNGGQTTNPLPAYEGSGIELLVESDDGSTISVWPGEQITRRVLLSKAVSTISTELTLQSSDAALTLAFSSRGGILRLDGRNMLPGTSFSATLTAKNLDNGSTVQVPFTIQTLSPTIVATGQLTSSGGSVISPGGSIGLQVEPNQLTSPLGVKISTAPLPLARTRVRIQFDRDVSNENGIVKLISNRFIASKTSNEPNTREILASHPRIMSLSNPPYPLIEKIVSYEGYFIANGNYRLASVFNHLYSIGSGTCEGETSSRICLDFDPAASELVGVKTAEDLIALRDDALLHGQVLVPVLFIHGFKAEIGNYLSGGQKTWNDFPKLVQGLSGAKEIFVPFEFRWRSNASFRVVADELASALIRIYQLTGRPTRVIAHSFGGVLTRTLLQGLAADQKTFDPAHVQSVLTLATPHSGIFDKTTTVSEIEFPNGQDAFIFEFCDQVSCHQAGENVGWDGDNVHVGALVDAGPRGNIMVQLAAKRDKLPRTLPFIVGIGMQVVKDLRGDPIYKDGDSLIRFAGQRFYPTSDGAQQLLVCSGDQNVSEIVLGAEIDGAPDLSARPGSAATGPSHKHSGAPEVTQKGTGGIPLVISVGEAYAVGSDASATTHSSFKLFKAIVEQPTRYCDARAEAPLPTANSLIGSTVTLYGFSPNVDTEFIYPNSQVVSLGVEYPIGSLQDIEFRSGVPIDVKIDIASNYIEAYYPKNALARSGIFNGYVFDFSASGLTIVDAKLDASSSFSSSQARVTFDASSVSVNIEGTNIRAGSRFLIKLRFANDGS